jgi:predicted transcriptional regulator
MTEIDEKIKNLILHEYGSINEFSKRYKIPQSTVFTAFKRGLNSSNLSTVSTIAHALDISIDGIARGKIEPTKRYAFTDLEQLRDDINKNPFISLGSRRLTKKELFLLNELLTACINVLNGCEK